MSETKINTVNLVSQRVQKTKKEIEELKAELQKLINNGINETKPLDSNLNENTKINDKTGTNVIKSTTSIKQGTNNRSRSVSRTEKFAQKRVPSVSSTDNVKKDEISPRKVRNYDPEEAREYIRKQREKRSAERKLQKVDDKIMKDDTKQKLKELHKKSLELVTKNVQFKRERSQSREKKEVPDNKEVPTEKKKQVPNLTSNSKDNLIKLDNKIDSIKLKPKKGLHPHITCRTQINRNETPKLHSINQSTYRVDDVKEKAAVKIQSVYKGYRQRKRYKAAVIVKRKLEENRTLKAQSVAFKEKASVFKEDSNTFREANRAFEEGNRAFEEGNEAFREDSNRAFRKDSNRAFREDSNRAFRKDSNRAFREDSNRAFREDSNRAFKEDNNRLFREETRALQEEIRAFEDVLHKHRTEEKLKNQFKNNRRQRDRRTVPQWLQANATPSNPYNFINTVKRKLNLAINSVNSETSGSGSSAHDDLKTKKEIHELLEKSIKSNKSFECKSFLSHKRFDIVLNDPPLIHLNNMKVPSHCSDSDTSKNIPDISSESNSKSKTKSRSKSKSNNDIIETVINSSLQFQVDAEESKENVSSIKTLSSKGFNNKRSIKGGSPINIDDRLFTNTLQSPVDSIIASNKCSYNYSTNESIKSLENEEKESSPSNSTPPEILQSFLDYMNDYNKTPTVSKSPVEEKKFYSLPTSSVKTNTQLHEDKLINKPSSLSEETNNSSVKQKYSSDFTDAVSTVPSLIRPSISLHTSQDFIKSNQYQILNKTNSQTISLKHGEKTTVESVGNTNQIHLKFEAELHLLNDFNESLQKFMAVDKSLLELQNKNSSKTILQTRDTQTSFASKSISNYIPEEKLDTNNTTENIVSVMEKTSNESDDVTNNVRNALSLNSSSIGLDLSQLNEISEISTRNNQISLLEPSIKVNDIRPTLNDNLCAGISLDMFEQFIKDEDARLENLKMILKIREKSLLDRTKGELAWLEIQKKHLKESGQLHEVSLVKKKQRGLLIKLQHERHEMQRLKQMQKAASKERKTILKEQRNLIKSQLSTNNLITKIKKNIPKERRQSGPLRVYNVKTQLERVTSETSVSKQSSATEEIISVTSQSVISAITSDVQTEHEDDYKDEKNLSVRSHSSEHVKRSLLMREAALQRRKKAAEELLQWHQRLLEEEKKISELEMAANTIINQFSGQVINPNSSNEQQQYKITGKQLNTIWENMTARSDNKFKDTETYSVSQNDLERFCKDTKRFSIKDKEIINNNNNRLNSTNTLSIESDIVTENTHSNDDVIKTQEFTSSNIYNYTSDFNTIETNRSVSTEKNVAMDERAMEDRVSSSLTLIKENIGSITNEISEIQELSIVNTSSSVRLSDVNSIKTNKIDDFDEDGSGSAIKNEIISQVQENLNSNNSSSSSELLSTDLNHKESDKSITEINELETPITEVESNVSNKQPEEDLDNLESKLTNDLIPSVTERSVTVKLQETVSEKLEEFTKREKSNEDIGANQVDQSSNIIDDSDKKYDVTDIVSELSHASSTKSQVTTRISEEEINSKGKPETVHAAEDSSDMSQLASEIYEINKESEKWLESDVVSEISEDATDKSGDATDKYGDATEKSEVATEKSGDATEKFGISTDKSGDTQERSGVITEKFGVATETSGVVTEKSGVATETSGVTTEKSGDVTKKSAVASERSEVATEKSEDATDKSEDATDKSGVATEKFEDATEKSEDVTKKSEIATEKFGDDEYKENTANLQEISDKIVKTASFDDISEESKNVTYDSQNTSKDFQQSIENDLDTMDDSVKLLVDEKVTILPKPSIQEISRNVLLSVKDDAVEMKSSTESEGDLSDEASTPDFSNEYEFNSQKDSVSKPNKLESPNESNDHPSLVKDNDVSDSLLKSNKSMISMQEAGEEIANNDDNDELSINDKKESLSLSYGIINDKSDSSIINSAVSSNKDESAQKSMKELRVDIKKRVSEILADASSNTYRNENSPRLQDLYCTTYDLNSPDHSPESDSINDPFNKEILSAKFGDEAEQLLKKQLAIEQEIKQLEQQQKEQIPYLYVREIPNKPPPPYTPPSTQVVPIPPSVLPSNATQVDLIVDNIINNANINNQFEIITYSDVDLKCLDDMNLTKTCYELIFDLSKEISLEYYSQFKEEPSPSWMKLKKSNNPFLRKKIDKIGLGNYLKKKIKQILGFEKLENKQKTLMKWSHKKRDHVDELLILESQCEESQWTNYDYDELIVKNDLTNDIMNLLLSETANVMKDILIKKSSSC